MVRWLLFGLVLLLSGCLESQQERTPEVLLDAQDATLLDEAVLVARDDPEQTIYLSSEPLAACARPDSLRESRVERLSNRLVLEGADRIVGQMEVDGQTTGHRLGVSFEGGEIVWGASSKDGPVRVEVPVLPGQEETSEPRWEFYVQLHVDEAGLECPAGLNVGDYRWTFHALPPGVDAPNP